MSAARTADAAPRALITNAEQRSVLASCRGLAAAGYRVSAIAFAERAAAHSSRCCEERLRMTDPAVDAERFMGELARQLARERYDVLIPGSDTSLLAISEMRERVQDLTRIGLPAHAVVQRSLDREAVAVAAQAAGLTAPRSTHCAGVQDALAAAREYGFPVLVKSICTAIHADGTVAQGTPSCLVEDEQELADAVGADGQPCLIQAAEQGEPYSFGGVMIDGRLVAVSMSCYRRTWPPGAGYAAFAETIDPPPALVGMIEALMSDLGWQGIFELELIRTALERFVPIDLNPRPYGSLALAVSAGAPLPSIWCDWLLQRGANPAANGAPVLARAGYGYRWEDADLRNVVWLLRRGRLASAVQAARPRRHVTHAYFRIRDPLPFAVRCMDIVGNRIDGSAQPDAPAATPVPGADETPAGQ